MTSEEYQLLKENNENLPGQSFYIGSEAMRIKGLIVLYEGQIEAYEELQVKYHELEIRCWDLQDRLEDIQPFSYGES